MTAQRRGFTLIELLLVIGIIAILASIVIVAINPTKRLADARNAQRRSDVNTVLNAVYQYAIDNNGNLPFVITGSATEICQTGGDCEANGPAGALDLSTDLVTTYLVSIPVDPQHPSDGDDGTDYTIVQSGGRVTVAAPGAEQGEVISVTR